MPNEPKLHHFLPRAYLRGFSDANGSLWVCDRLRGAVRRQRPDNTGAEQEMYTRELGEKRNRDVERVLAQAVDGPGSAVIHYLRDGGQRPLLEEQRLPLAVFTAALILRGPMYRGINQRIAEGVRQWLSKILAGFARVPQGHRPVPHVGDRGVDSNDLLQWLQEARAARRPYQNHFVSTMIRLLPRITRVVLSLDWAIAYAPEGESFITCDAPLLYCPPPNFPRHIGLGLALPPGVEKVVPLASNVALLMYDLSDAPRIDYGVMDANRLRTINEEFMHQSRRFAIGDSQPLLENLLRATGIAGTEPPPLIRFDGGN